ncbi:LysR family transcriptional regulator [Pseudomonas typographi]|uniref:LysR family transcriptional regulator n=1 Tax=Pseudomonas typographi TaxID=2715964 RepID=UPI0016895062|nr:LysR family transcriptional regulator [Pseudomonas typographi]MBD1551592.1 LysR family transcriptional regulator [Pseudomonas typographi]
MNEAYKKYTVARYFRYFDAAARHLNLTRAAAELGIAQPPFSQQLRKLEELIGVPLFERLPRGLRLTEAGAAFAEETQRIMALLGRASEKARQVGLGLEGKMTVGFCNSTVFLQPLADLIRHYRELYPRVHFDPSEASTTELVEQVRAAQLDAAVIRLPYGDLQGLCVHPILVESMWVAAPPAWSKANGELGDLAQLAEQPLILFPRRTGPELFDAILEACRSRGFEPRLTQSSSQIASAINLVAGGFGWAIVPQSICDIHRGAVAYHPLTQPLLESGIALIYEGAPLPAVERLAALVEARKASA